MDIIKVTIENFLTIGHADLDLVGKGLVLIQGENQDDTSTLSNGAGKSSIPDALCWALYGVTARGETGDAVVNETEGKNCSVMVTLHDGDSVYFVTRNRKHAVNKNRLQVMEMPAADYFASGTAGSTHTDHTKGTDKLTQELVEKIVGCSVEVFSAAVYAGQESMPDLPAMTDKMLKMLVEEAAGVDRLQEGYEIAKQRKSKAEKDRDAALTRKSTLEVSIDGYGKQLVSIGVQKGEWQREHEEDIAIKQATAKSNIEEAVKLKKKVGASGADQLKAELAKLDAQIDGHDKEVAQRQSLDKEARAKENALIQAKTDLKHAIAKLKTVKSNLEDVDNTIGKPCGECGKVYEKNDLASVRQIREDDIAKQKRVVLDAEAKANLAEQAYQSASKTLDDYVATMTDVSKVVAEQKRLNAELAAIDADVSKISTLKQQSQKMVDEVKAMRTKKNPFDTQISDVESAMTEAKDELANLVSEIAEREKWLEVSEGVVSVFSPAGVRAHILDTVTPYLNDRTAHYLGNLSDGNIEAIWNTLSTTAKGELREKFNIAVTNNKGAQSFRGLSGGEKRKVRLATALALQDMVASRAAKPINIFIADEVDHALDAAGLERLMSSLEDKARERGTVLVISHNELSDWCREQATVVKSGGKATVTGALTA